MRLGEEEKNSGLLSGRDGSHPFYRLEKRRGEERRQKGGGKKQITQTPLQSKSTLVGKGMYPCACADGVEELNPG